MTVLKWTIFFKNQSFEHDIIIYNFVALSVSSCLYHRDLISKVQALIRFVKCINIKKMSKMYLGHMMATYKIELLIPLIG